MKGDIFSDLVKSVDALASERRGNLTVLPDSAKRSKPGLVCCEESHVLWERACSRKRFIRHK